MKHQDLISYVNEKLSKEQQSSILKIRKGSSSGNNYINILFTNNKDRESVMNTLDVKNICMERYGIGLLLHDHDLYESIAD